MLKYMFWVMGLALLGENVQAMRPGDHAAGAETAHAPRTRSRSSSSDRSSGIDLLAAAAAAEVAGARAQAALSAAATMPAMASAGRAASGAHTSSGALPTGQGPIPPVSTTEAIQAGHTTKVFVSDNDLIQEISNIKQIIRTSKENGYVAMEGAAALLRRRDLPRTQETYRLVNRGLTAGAKHLDMLRKGAMGEVFLMGGLYNTMLQLWAMSEEVNKYRHRNPRILATVDQILARSHPTFGELRSKFMGMYNFFGGDVNIGAPFARFASEDVKAGYAQAQALLGSFRAAVGDYNAAVAPFAGGAPKFFDFYEELFAPLLHLLQARFAIMQKWVLALNKDLEAIQAPLTGPIVSATSEQSRIIKGYALEIERNAGAQDRLYRGITTPNIDGLTPMFVSTFNSSLNLTAQLALQKMSGLTPAEIVRLSHTHQYWDGPMLVSTAVLTPHQERICILGEQLCGSHPSGVFSSDVEIPNYFGGKLLAFLVKKRFSSAQIDFIMGPPHVRVKYLGGAPQMREPAPLYILNSVELLIRNHDLCANIEQSHREWLTPPEIGMKHAVPHRLVREYLASKKLPFVDRPLNVTLLHTLIQPLKLQGYTDFQIVLFSGIAPPIFMHAWIHFGPRDYSHLEKENIFKVLCAHQYVPDLEILARLFNLYPTQIQAILRDNVMGPVNYHERILLKHELERRNSDWRAGPRIVAQGKEHVDTVKYMGVPRAGGAGALAGQKRRAGPMHLLPSPAVGASAAMPVYGHPTKRMRVDHSGGGGSAAAGFTPYGQARPGYHDAVAAAAAAAARGPAPAAMAAARAVSRTLPAMHAPRVPTRAVTAPMAADVSSTIAADLAAADRRISARRRAAAAPLGMAAPMPMAYGASLGGGGSASILGRPPVSVYATGSSSTGQQPLLWAGPQRASRADVVAAAAAAAAAADYNLPARR